MNRVTTLIFERYRAGMQTLLVTGRCMSDLDLDANGSVRPLEFLLAAHAAAEFKMGTLHFDLARGPRWDLSHFPDQKQADAFRTSLSQAGIQYADAPGGYERPPHERACSLLRQINCALGRESLPPHFILFQFIEDVVGDTPGLPQETVLQAVEFISILSTNYSARRHSIFLVFSSQFPEAIPPRILRDLPSLHIPNPDRAAKKVFIQALKKSRLRQDAVYGAGLDEDAAANLTANTPNTGLERVFLEAAKLGQPITENQLLEQKRQDILRLSQGTLCLLDSARIRGVSLRGRMVSKPLSLFQSWGTRLKISSPKVPRNILLCGPPSSAKTDLAHIAAESARVNAVQLVSPKGSLVGETERQARLQSRCLLELAPVIGFVDEITEAFPTSRSEVNLDAGASAAIVAELLNVLSDKSRAGRAVFLGATNLPWKIGTALASRFLVVPALSAIQEDYPAILVSIATGIESSFGDALEENPTIREAAQMFFEKGCSPRLIRESLVVTAAITDQPLSPDLILESAKTAAEGTQRDRASSEFADLYAIKLASDRRFFPWAEDPERFPYPTYLKGIVRRDGGVDQEKIDIRLAELRPHVDL